MIEAYPWMPLNPRHEMLHWKMSRTVQDYVKNYQTDFALDAYILAAAEEGDWYVWFVRENGSHVYRLDGSPWEETGISAAFEVFGREILETGGVFLIHVTRKAGLIPEGEIFVLPGC